MKIFIMKRTMWLFIHKKVHLLVVMNFWNKKYGLVIWLEHHKMEKIILIHIPNFLFRLKIYNVIQDDKFIWRIFSLKTLTV
jgi:hypothetical protein